jgi:glutamate--cysteine ligase
MTYTLPYREWLNLFAAPSQSRLLEQYQAGLEREALRVGPTGHLVSTGHPVGLGSALTHPEITTDFAEAQLELITPPYQAIDTLLDYQTRLHAFAAQRLPDNEQIWFQSMPPALQENQIQIAQFGTSHQGRVKEIYRNGLAHRYGKQMQVISGIHFNYSFHMDFWKFIYDQVQTRSSLLNFISENYLGLMRNYLRQCWLLAYLFGAAPLADPVFEAREMPEVIRDQKALYGPMATSLRMSRLGYVNSNRCTYSINYNSLTEYLAGLYKAINSECSSFLRFGRTQDGEYLQLNTHILQIENEHYALIRPKQPPLPGERPFSSLRSRGIGYVEVRALDVNPFEVLGVSADQLNFVRLFLLHCLLDPNPPIGSAELELVNENQHWVAIQGRQPGMRLLRPEGSVSLKDWGYTIFEALEPLAQSLDSNRESPLYGPLLARERIKLDHPELTPSAQVLADFQASGQPFTEWMTTLSQAHMNNLKAFELSVSDESAFKQAVQNSLQKQAEIEASDSGTFEDYLAAFLRIKEWGLESLDPAPSA